MRSECTAISGDEHRIFDRGKPNEYLITKIISCLVTNDEDGDLDGDLEKESRTDLDSHANMAVVGRNATVLAETGNSVDVNPFAPDCNSLKQVKIVDAAVRYSCPYTSKEYCLVLRNCLHVPSMENNLMQGSVRESVGASERKG